jgi:hypothetical protein
VSNGLDKLTQRRQRRQAPPPKHPRTQPEEQLEPEAVAADPAGEIPAPGASAQPAPEPAAERRRSKTKAAERSDATRSKRTPSVEAYLDQELMDWLWEIEAAAVARRERSVTSPAIRLALRELKKRMTPEQVVDALLSQAPGNTGRPGRPRR